MTISKKILLSFSILIIIGVVSIFSWSYGFKQGIRAGGVSSSLAEFYLFHEHVTDQLSNANCEGAKSALLDELALIEKYKDKEGSLITRTVYYADKMLDHIRLSRIEKQLGNVDSSQSHMKIAIEACSQRGWKDCSNENLTHFANKFDEKHPIACLSK